MDLRVLVVGCGSIGERHLRNLLSLGLRDVRVCEPNLIRLDAIKAQYSVRGYRLLEEAMEMEPQLSFICLPNHLHLGTTTTLAQAGSHLLIEKPLADRLDGVAELVYMIEQKELVCLVGCNMRFHPAIVRLKQIIDSGRIGRVLSLRIHYGYYLPNWRPQLDYRKVYSSQASQGGGIILDDIHELDYARWFVGEVEGVMCFAAKVSDLEIDVEDTADILLRFSVGTQAAIHMDYLDQINRRSCEVVGSHGTVIWRSVGKQPEIAVVEHYINNRIASKEEFEVDPNHTYIEELKHLLAVIEGKEIPTLSIRDAWADLAIALAARQSAATGQSVPIEAVWRIESG